MEVAMATRRQRPDRAGHDASERGIIMPAPARTQPQLCFRISTSFACASTAAAAAELP